MEDTATYDERTVSGDGLVKKPKGETIMQIYPPEPESRTIFISGMIEAAQRVRNAS